jgi:hypothetical protein
VPAKGIRRPTVNGIGNYKTTARKLEKRRFFTIAPKDKRAASGRCRPLCRYPEVPVLAATVHHVEGSLQVAVLACAGARGTLIPVIDVRHGRESKYRAAVI